MDDVLGLMCEALSHAGEDPQLMEHLARLEERRITPDKELPEMEFLFRLFSKPCFPRGELVALTGRPKSGKTFVCSVLMTLCFRPEVLTMMRASPEVLRVLWYDTEQSDGSTQDILRNRIVPMITEQPVPVGDTLTCVDASTLFPSSAGPVDGADAPFQVFNVRQEPWRDRMALLEVAIERYHPDLVIVDGIRDLIDDINDGVVAQETVERLMKLASVQRCCMVCVLHQNKSSEDTNLRGWIGTELTHKAFELYECGKDIDRIFSLTQRLTRKYDIMDSLRYVLDERGIPQLATIEALLESEQRQRMQNEGGRPELNRTYITGWEGSTPIFDLPRLFADALPEVNTLYVAKDVQEQVMKLGNITSPFFYNKLRERALQDRIVKKTANEFGHVCYYRGVEPQGQMGEGSYSGI